MLQLQSTVHVNDKSIQSTHNMVLRDIHWQIHPKLIQIDGASVYSELTRDT